jgi:hypothetical protein
MVRVWSALALTDTKQRALRQKRRGVRSRLEVAPQTSAPREAGASSGQPHRRDAPGARLCVARSTRPWGSPLGQAQDGQAHEGNLLMAQSLTTPTHTTPKTVAEKPRSATRPRWAGTVRCRSRALAAPVVLVLIALIPLGATRPVPAWTAAFHQAMCVGACCVITDGFFELSCGEYTPSPAALGSTAAGTPQHSTP